MANRFFFMKKQETDNDFIHIDLLPDMKRPRQFNVNILLIVIMAVALSWILIYIPLVSRQAHLDQVLEDRADMQYRLLLVNEQVSGFNIEPHRVEYSNYINYIEGLNVDWQIYYNELYDTVQLHAFNVGVTYNSVTHTFVFSVEAINESTFRTIDFALVELPFVESINYEVSYTHGSPGYILAIFEIEVIFDAE